MNVVFVIFFSFIASVRSGHHWTYESEEDWPGKCQTGTRQSPINIVTKDALEDRHGAHIRGPLGFRGYGNVRLRGKNNGHSLQWDVQSEPRPVLLGGPLRTNYTLMQFHLHWLSEHAIDGKKYALEIHMVHVKSGLSVQQALDQPDGLAVIGIMCNVRVDKEAKHALEELMGDVTQLFHANTVSEDILTVDLTRLFSPVMQSYYTYHGSLTTPMCQEVVTWIVMDKPLDISDVQYKVISRVDVGGINNYRSLQPADRVVYKSAYASCGAAISPSFSGFAVALATCLANKLSGALNKGACLLSNLKKKYFGGTSCLLAQTY